MIKFGLGSAQLVDIARELEAVLNVAFELHDSQFRGGDYFRATVSPGNILLQRNYEPGEKQAFEVIWPIGNAILYLDGPDDEAWDLFENVLKSQAKSLGATYLGRSIG